ncbi:MAG TPA: tRNA (adenosine(37)-N6)-threonylcarbamoyltransferase complex transferase subunit TsaD [Rickettsiales bacterium]|nr:tRNA (adenosine(37)-N6)-threonylcarbamoyltransferase complex transferase subunit TsaD [Rickettsiales bacterium]
MKVLGIESSCDETAIAIVNDNKEILSNVVVSQIDIHKVFGGVIPEIASRNHLDIIDKIVLKALNDAGLKFEDLDAISATCGPGLMGGLIVGAITGQTLASIFDKPFIPVNHLEGHVLTSRLTNNLEFPFLIFLISGGHSQILLAKGVGDYEKIGDTIDDSLGECFDKVAQMLGLEYPGGPKIENLAEHGDENRFKFVKPLIDAIGKGRSVENNFNFSFSGLKTAVRREVEKLTGMDYNYEISHTKLSQKDICDISASFQKTIVDILKDRFKNVVQYLEKQDTKLDKLIFAGGVSANQYIKNNMIKYCKNFGFDIVSPPLKLCTDNGVMIAWAGLEKFRLNKFEKQKKLIISSRWELSK